MSRVKRSRGLESDEQQNDREAEQIALAAEENNSDENDIRTPPKRVRLNLAESSVNEEIQAVAYVDVPQVHLDGSRPVITPGHSDSKKHRAEGNTSNGSLLFSPSEETESNSDAVCRSLFTTRDTLKPQLVTPARAQSTAHQSPAKRRLLFGRLTSEIVVSDGVKTVYGVIRKLTGSIGGNASHGPIYGELTMGSMQKMVNLMKEHTSFDRSSRFLDVGSGIGKPNFHVAHDPGVELSYGLEIDSDRWLLSMNCLRGLCSDVDKAGNTEISSRSQRCIFVQGDIRAANVFDPFTHIYMFSIGFPPALWVDLAEIWNRSSSLYLICFHGPKDIIRSYEFDVDLIAQTPTSMHGSKEGHTGYLYRRQSKTKPSNIINNDAVVDPLFAEGIERIRSGATKTWVESTLYKKMSPGATTRARRRSMDKSGRGEHTS